MHIMSCLFSDLVENVTDLKVELSCMVLLSVGQHLSLRSIDRAKDAKNINHIFHSFKDDFLEKLLKFFLFVRSRQQRAVCVVWYLG